MIDTYWSDHCRHTTFLTTLDAVDVRKAAVEKAFQRYLAARKTVYGDRERPMNLMDIATIGTKTLKKRGLLPELDESEEIDGVLLLLNTCGGDVEAGLAIAELIEGMRAPTVSLVLGGGRSIGVPLAVEPGDVLEKLMGIHHADRHTDRNDQSQPDEHLIRQRLTVGTQELHDPFDGKERKSDGEQNPDRIVLGRTDQTDGEQSRDRLDDDGHDE